MPPEDKTTRYLILETDEDALTFTRVGEVNANGSEEAIRKFQSDPPVDREGFLVAVSENSFKLRKTRARVTTSLSDVEIPGLAAPTPIGATDAGGPAALVHEEPEPAEVA